jgi:hypothetical protein
MTELHAATRIGETPRRTRRPRPSAEGRYDVAVWGRDEQGARRMEVYTFVDATTRNRLVDFAFRHDLTYRVSESRAR